MSYMPCMYIYIYIYIYIYNDEDDTNKTYLLNLYYIQKLLNKE